MMNEYTITGTAKSMQRCRTRINKRKNVCIISNSTVQTLLKNQIIMEKAEMKTQRAKEKKQRHIRRNNARDMRGNIKMANDNGNAYGNAYDNDNDNDNGDDNDNA
jgi:hypothetical protein